MPCLLKLAPLNWQLCPDNLYLCCSIFILMCTIPHCDCATGYGRATDVGMGVAFNDLAFFSQILNYPQSHKYYAWIPSRPQSSEVAVCYEISGQCLIRFGENFKLRWWDWKSTRECLKCGSSLVFLSLSPPSLSKRENGFIAYNRKYM